MSKVAYSRERSPSPRPRAPPPPARRRSPQRSHRARLATELDFGLPLRAFIKRYSNGLGGPQKFTLLLAYMAKGKAGVSVAFPDIKKLWNRMTGLTGGQFHNVYAARARDEAWVDTPKNGQYALRANWADALGKK